MADTYSARLRFAKQTVGGNSATWGTILNTLFDSLDDAIAGMATLSTTGGTYTLSTANNSDDEARNAILKVTGVLVSNSEVVVPSSSKRYTVWNATSGSYTCTVKTSGGSGIAVTQGKVMDLFCDGTNVKAVNTELQSPTISGATLTTPTITVADNVFTIQDNADTAKQGAFQLSGITTGNTRTLTWPDASGTIALTSDVVAAATQSEQETGSSTTTTVTPGRQQFHPSAAKGWVQATAAGVATGSYNVTSITDGGAGDMTVVWATDFSATTYAVVATAMSTPQGTEATTNLVQIYNNLAAGTTQVGCLRVDTGAGTDPNGYHVIAFGDQA